MARSPKVKGHKQEQRRQHRKRTNRNADGSSASDLIVGSKHEYDGAPLANPSKSQLKEVRGNSGNKNRGNSGYKKSRIGKSIPKGSALSASALAQLDALNNEQGWTIYDGLKARQRQRSLIDDQEAERRRNVRREQREERRRRRNEIDARLDHGTKERRQMIDGTYKTRKRDSQSDIESQTDPRDEKPPRVHVRRESVVRFALAQREDPSRTRDLYKHKRRSTSSTHIEHGTDFSTEKHPWESHVEYRASIASSSTSDSENPIHQRTRRNIIIGILIVLVILAVVIPVAVIVSNKRSTTASEAVTSVSANATAQSSTATRPARRDGGGYVTSLQAAR